MKETKTKLKELGFTQGHAHLLLVAVAFFAVLTFVQSDLSLKALFANADDEVVMLTFDQVQSEVEAEYGGISTEADAVAEEQLALLDRQLDEGTVLGEAIGLGAIPSAESLYSPEQLNSVKIFSVVPTDQQSVVDYYDRILRIKSYYDTTQMFANLNSNSPEAMKDTQDTAKEIVYSMEQIPVPSELVEYHKYNVFYYQTLAAIAEPLSGGEGDLSSYSKTLFSLMNKIGNIESGINSKYNIPQ